MHATRDDQGQAVSIQRADYSAPAFWIDTVDLTFDLDPAKTRVLNKMRLRRNPDVPVQPLRLDGEELNLARVLVNGASASFKIEGKQLVLDNLPSSRGWRFRPGDLHHLPAGQEHQADGPVRQQRARSSRSARPKASGASPTSWTAPM